MTKISGYKITCLPPEDGRDPYMNKEYWGRLRRIPWHGLGHGLSHEGRSKDRGI